jgi:hypothetical protein
MEISPLVFRYVAVWYALEFLLYVHRRGRNSGLIMVIVVDAGPGKSAPALGVMVAAERISDLIRLPPEQTQTGRRQMFALQSVSKEYLGEQQEQQEQQEQDF